MMSPVLSFEVIKIICYIKYNKWPIPDHLCHGRWMLKQVLLCTVRSSVLLSCSGDFCGLSEFLKRLIVITDNVSQKPFVSLFSNWLPWQELCQFFSFVTYNRSQTWWKGREGQLKQKLLRACRHTLTSFRSVSEYRLKWHLSHQTRKQQCGIYFFLVLFSSDLLPATYEPLLSCWLPFGLAVF